jgi:hypothetical protein
MATRTWKLGELSRGGVITVEVKKDSVAIIAKEWDMSQGTQRGSSQKNAKEWDRLEVRADERETYWKLLNYLNDLTTSYHADKIIKWIESKTKLTFRF